MGRGERGGREEPVFQQGHTTLVSRIQPKRERRKRKGERKKNEHEFIFQDAYFPQQIT